jgi:hypothetical protein
MYIVLWTMLTLLKMLCMSSKALKLLHNMKYYASFPLDSAQSSLRMIKDCSLSYAITVECSSRPVRRTGLVTPREARLEVRFANFAALRAARVPPSAELDRASGAVAIAPKVRSSATYGRMRAIRRIALARP